MGTIPRMKNPFTTWICAGSTVNPKPTFLSIRLDSACSVQVCPFDCSHKAQKKATKAKMPARLPMVLRPSGESTSFNHALPAGGTMANFFRPLQNTAVATNMATAGMPKAQRGPKLSLFRSTGQK